jgi:phosphoribosyl 1,2-cyclic phosphodiesterase
MQLPLSLSSPGSRVVVLGSGSAGNVLVVECGGRRLMVDAGFSCKQIEHRLGLVGLDGDGFDGIVLTHEHQDHCRGAARFARRHGLTVHATAGTLEALEFFEVDFPTSVLRSGVVEEIGSFAVEPFAVPHDAREPVGLVVEDSSGNRIGLAADLGARSQLAWGRLRELDALVLETNHDLEMLRSGPYPWPLKQRVAGRHGHLSNREAAEGVPELLCDRLRWVVLYHLSRTNNLPVLAAEAVLEALDREGSPARICVSEQTQPSAWLQLSGVEALPQRTAAPAAIG